MDQPAIQIRATNQDGVSADITSLCRTISWSGSYLNAARTLAFAPLVCDTPGILPRAPIELGGHVQLSVDGNLLMDAWSLERTRDSLSNSVDVTAYDRGLYLTRNSKTMRIAGQTPETVTASLCKEFGIKVDALAATGVPITRNFWGVSLYKIIMTLYTLAADQTGRKYRLRFAGEGLEVVEMAQTPQSILLEPGCNLLCCTTRESASRMTNSVALYNDEYKQIALQEDKELVRLYGLMREAVKASAYDDPVAHAKKVIADNGLQTTMSVTALGNTKLITGNTVVLKEPVTGVYGLFWITSDTHTWQRNIYQTKLGLSFEAIMDSQSAGSVPTK